MATIINQKEYLKRYLWVGKAPGEKRKKMKKEKSIGDRLKIIDDDADVLISQEIQDDIAAANEDAPHIVAVIDERPPLLRVDEQTKSNLWTPIGETSSINNTNLRLSNTMKIIKQSKSKSRTLSNLKTINRLREDIIYELLRSQADRVTLLKQYAKSDMASPPRIKISKEDNSLTRKGNKDDDDLLPNNKNKEDWDYSPPRRRYRKDVSPSKSEKYDGTYSPRRKIENSHQLHEMSKPLARYADDKDLEKYLKEKERDGDPMSAYIRRKKKEQAAAADTSEQLVYLGAIIPNRFGIRPGYRWDGVDRSNGYETKWFQVQNSKRATQEEAFKWGTEDM